MVRASASRSLRPARRARANPRYRVTEDQRKLIFALGRARGLDLDDLRGMTPSGSVSRLTQREAAELIAALQGGIGSRRPPTDAGLIRQLLLIEYLGKTLLRFDEDKFSEWLRSRFGARSVGEIRDRELARRVIASLSAIHRHPSDPARVGFTPTPVDGP